MVKKILHSLLKSCVLQKDRGSGGNYMKNKAGKVLGLVLTCVLVFALIPIRYLAAESHSFVIQPDGPNSPLQPTENYNLTWQTDFNQVKAEIGYTKDSAFHVVYSLSNLGREGKQLIGYSDIVQTDHWSVRAYYDTDSYVSSSYFSISLFSRQF